MESKLKESYINDPSPLQMLIKLNPIQSTKLFFFIRAYYKTIVAQKEEATTKHAGIISPLKKNAVKFSQIMTELYKRKMIKDQEVNVIFSIRHSPVMVI